jgi:hypothetical protein
MVVFDNGTEINCYADPNRGFLFKEWEIDSSTSPNSTRDLSLSVTNQEAIGAEFYEVIPYSLLIGFIAIAVVCIAVHFTHWRLILFKEKIMVKRFNRKIKTIGEGADEDKQNRLEQLEEVKKEISRLFQEGKISEENYKKIEHSANEYVHRIESTRTL